MLPCAVPAAPQSIHHHMDVTLDPARAALEVADRMRVAGADAGRIVVRLNADLRIREVRGVRIEGRSTRHHVQEIALRLSRDGAGEVTMIYGGQPRMDVGGAGPREWLDADGAHLGAASAWYPRIGGALHTHDLSVRLPSGWQALAPGRAAAPRDGSTARWIAERPVEDIDLVAGPFRVHRRMAAWGTAEVWLRAPDPPLAETYLDAITRHLPFYADLIGPYPFSRFTVVENLRPTGWGMPGFTLLGARVMRLPFIPHTSLPHEVLHNWWGNGVLVDLAEGNWSEGLTAYLADHLLAEHRGEGARHRRDALARFRAAAGEGAGTVPARFVARHDRRSQSVGYDKPLMILHMARRARGDRAFVQALRRLYADGLGRRVGAREVLAALAPEGEDWFAAWWQRPGAPRLALECCQVSAGAEGHRVTGTIRQVQDGSPFPLRVPVQVLVAGEFAAREHPVAMQGRVARFAFSLPARPLALAVDGAFDLMRIPDPAELPPAVGELLDAARPVAVLAPGLSVEMAAAYRAIAGAVGARVVEDAAAPGGHAQATLEGNGPAAVGGDVLATPAAEARAALETDAVWILGAEAPLATPWRDALARRIAAGDSRVMVVRDGDGRSIALVDAATPAAARALAGKLPHYGRHGLLGFAGDEARSVFTGETPAAGSPLRVTFDGHPPEAAIPLAPRAALAP